MKVETYHLHRPDGSHIRMATRVVFDDGEVVAFTERMSKREAIKQAEAVRSNETRFSVPFLSEVTR